MVDVEKKNNSFGTCSLSEHMHWCMCAHESVLSWRECSVRCLSKIRPFPSLQLVLYLPGMTSTTSLYVHFTELLSSPVSQTLVPEWDQYLRCISISFQQHQCLGLAIYQQRKRLQATTYILYSSLYLKWRKAFVQNSCFPASATTQRMTGLQLVVMIQIKYEGLTNSTNSQIVKHTWRLLSDWSSIQ